VEIDYCNLPNYSSATDGILAFWQLPTRLTFRGDTALIGDRGV
jgi:hypothetical protein